MSKAVDGGKGPWCDIAYSFLVCRHGEVYEGRGWKNRTAAQGTNAGNDNYVAICFLGGDKEGRDDVTQKGREAITDLINMAQKQIFKKKMDIEPHSHFHSTGCPGNELRKFITAHPWDAHH